MFVQLEVMEYQGKPLRSHRMYVMGQVCVARSHRRTGAFDALYAGHREHCAALVRRLAAGQLRDA